MIGVEQRFASSAKRMIARYGKTRVYKQLSQSEYDVEAQATVNSYVDTSVKMFQTSLSYSEQQTVNQTNKQMSVMLIAASDITFTPNKGDLIDSDGDVLRVERVIANWAGDVVALYRLLCVLN